MSGLQGAGFHEPVPPHISCVNSLPLPSERYPNSWQGRQPINEGGKMDVKSRGPPPSNVVEPLIHPAGLSSPEDSWRVCCKPQSVGKPRGSLLPITTSQSATSLVGRGFHSSREPVGSDLSSIHPFFNQPALPKTSC